MTSQNANKLADDLVTIGKILGFKSVKEAPVLEGSSYRVDVLWEMSGAINIASIEIQYSNSPTSISHNIFKAEPTLHPAIHVVISYNEVKDNYREILNLHPGVVLIEGTEEINRLNDQILEIINEPIESKRVELGNFFLQSLKKQKLTDKQKEKIIFELWLERLFEPVIYEITVNSKLFDSGGILGHTYFVTGTIHEARANALKLFKENMTDAPFEWDGNFLKLVGLEITCHQLIDHYLFKSEIEQEGIIYKVAVNVKVGSKKNYFEYTHAVFGRDPGVVEKTIFTNLNVEIEKMQSIPNNILEKKVYVGKYLKIKKWKEPIRGKILLITKVIPEKDEQIRMLKAYFMKEFGFTIEEFISLEDIVSNNRYSENLNYIKGQLSEMYGRYSEDFRTRMYEDSFKRFKDFLDIL